MWVAVNAIAGLTDRARQRLRGLAGRRLTADDRVHLSSDESRSQEGNRQAAIGRLREMIVEAMHEPKVRRKTKPSYGSKQRRLVAKKIRSDVKANRRGGFE
jgi:ribosome-associated protein